MIKQPRGKKTYLPKFPRKYKGQYPIIVRSTWEEAFMKWCDKNPQIVEWSSESIKIPYYDPIKGKRRYYYPDFMIKVRDSKDNIVSYIIEVKPHKETIPPRKSSRKSRKTVLTEHRTYKTNRAKWNAARDYATKLGYVFRIFTERELFGR